MRIQSHREIKLLASDHSDCHGHLNSNPGPLAVFFEILFALDLNLSNYVAQSKDGKRRRELRNFGLK